MPAMTTPSIGLPAPGMITAIVPAGADPAAARRAIDVAMAAGRSAARVIADAEPAATLTVAEALSLGTSLPSGPDRQAWLRPVPEISTRFGQRWSALGHAERYLVEVARARLARPDVVVLEHPASRLDGARTVRLVRELVDLGHAIVWLERRIRLIAAFEVQAWLVDGDDVVGPLFGPDLMADARAWRLCFGGRLART